MFALAADCTAASRCLKPPTPPPQSNWMSKGACNIFCSYCYLSTFLFFLSPLPWEPNSAFSASSVATQTSLDNALATAGAVASVKVCWRRGRRLSVLLCSTLPLLFYKQASSLWNHMLGNDESGGCIPCMSRDA